MELMKKISIIIPTYNRPQFINEILSYNSGCGEVNISIIKIYDSSSNFETEKVVQKYQVNSHLPVQYKHLPEEISVDDKMMVAITETNTDYVYLSGDSTVFDLHEFEKIFISEHFYDCDIIDLESICRKGRLNQDSNYEIDKLYKFSDINEYVKKYFSHITYLGAALVKTTFLKKSVNLNCHKYLTYTPCWWLPCCIVEAMCAEGRTFGVIYTSCIHSVGMTKKRTWDHGEDYLKIVFNVYNQNIFALPETITEETKYSMTSFFRKDALASNNYLLKKRMVGDLKYSWVKKYKEDIKYIKGYYVKMILISLIPIKFLIFLKKLWDKMKK